MRRPDRRTRCARNRSAKTPGHLLPGSVAPAATAPVHARQSDGLLPTGAIAPAEWRGAACSDRISWAAAASPIEPPLGTPSRMTSRTAVRALLAIALWGASFIATKVALKEISPLDVVVLRFALGILVMLVILAGRRQLRWPARGDVAWFALLGLNGITVHQLLQSNGLVTATATSSGWIIALIPVFTAVLAWLFLHEPFGRLKALGLAIASLGTFAIITSGDLRAGMLQRVTPGDLLMLVSALNWAIFTVLSKRVLESASPALSIAYVTVFGWLMTLPFLALEGGWQQIAGMSLVGWENVLFLGVGCSGLAYVFWYDALAETEATSLASFLYLEPIVTLVVAASFIGEAVRWPVVLGGATILSGVWLVNRPDSTRRASRRRAVAHGRASAGS
jgi:drug/metabolite transporter (DMT)-like permease